MTLRAALLPRAKETHCECARRPFIGRRDRNQGGRVAPEIQSDYLSTMRVRFCSGGDTGAGCKALEICPICETCEEHCLSGGSGVCLDAHDNWLAGGAGGVREMTAATPPGRPPFGAARTFEIRTALLHAQEQLAAENDLQRCVHCRGLEDPSRPHEHVDDQAGRG